MTNISDTPLKMNEDFLHYVWKFRLFNTSQLTTSKGLRLEILHPGLHNHHAGPDFLNAKLRIGSEIWVGQVEIHLQGSDWLRHGHTGDQHYDNVILHAVFVDDVEISLHSPGDLPVFVMSKYIIENQWNQYQYWLKNKTWIPCEKQIQSADSMTWHSWKDSLAVERLEQRATIFLEQLKNSDGNWMEIFYRKLAGNFGFKVNRESMTRLAEITPSSVLSRHRTDPFQVEALLFGQAGLLNQLFSDSYPIALQKEYIFLNQKYKLRQMNASEWNFGRMRPSNFPTIRIAQFASLFCKTEHLLSTILHETDPNCILDLFDVEIHEYWKDHFRFDARTTGKILSESSRPKKLGSDSISNIIINTVSATLFAYGRYFSEQHQIDKALQLLEFCTPEDNQIIRKWAALGIESENASDSQSLIQLFNVYCTSRRCLNCQIGLKLLKQED